MPNIDRQPVLRINWVIMMVNSNDAVVSFRVWMRAPGCVFDRVMAVKKGKVRVVAGEDLPQFCIGLRRNKEERRLYCCEVVEGVESVEA